MQKELNNNFILRGAICYSSSKTKIQAKENAYLICIDGKSKGVFDDIPAEYENLPIEDMGDCLIIPGMTDLHAHAPQYAFHGLGMDYELLDWLDNYAFVEESKYSDLEYAKKAYEIFVEDLKKTTTTRICLFATSHRASTELLMDILEDSGMISMVGLVEMDRNAPGSIRQKSAKASIEDTKVWLSNSKKYKNTFPIITPRFAITSTDEQLKELGKLQKETGLFVQSHLSENYGEIESVKELFPWSKNYADVYNCYNLFGGNGSKAIMAHCVHCTDDEISLMKGNNVFVAHCPDSNMNLKSGVAPVRKYLDRDLKMGLGTDVSGGSTLNMLETIRDTVLASKMRWRLKDESIKSVNAWEAFYLATVGGGEFFGKVGSFKEGYDFDVVVLDDRRYNCPYELSAKSRLERLFYMGTSLDTVHKYVKGKKLF